MHKFHLDGVRNLLNNLPRPGTKRIIYPSNIKMFSDKTILLFFSQSIKENLIYMYKSKLLFETFQIFSYYYL